jgi:hypothetical protein
MFVKRLTLPAGAAVLLALCATDARAEFVRWSFSASGNPTTIRADRGGSGKILLSGGSGQVRTALADIAAVNLRAISSAPRSRPETFTNKPYSLTLRITDDVSHASGSLTFRGVLRGTASSGGAFLVNKFQGPVAQRLRLGNKNYNVVIGAFSWPGTSNRGNIGASVAVSAGTLTSPRPLPLSAPTAGLRPLSMTLDEGPSASSAPVAEAPEPSGVVLAGLGLLLLAVCCWRKRARARKALAGV